MSGLARRIHLTITLTVGRVPASCCRVDALTGALVNEKLCFYDTDANRRQRDEYMHTKVGELLSCSFNSTLAAMLLAHG